MKLATTEKLLLGQKTRTIKLERTLLTVIISISSVYSKFEKNHNLHVAEMVLCCEKLKKLMGWSNAEVGLVPAERNVNAFFCQPESQPKSAYTIQCKVNHSQPKPSDTMQCKVNQS